MPKVLFTPFRAQVIKISALPSTGYEQTSHPLCPVWAFREYIERSGQFRQSEQLFVCFGGLSKGLPVTKQRLSHLIVGSILYVLGLRALSTRGIASFWAWSSRVSIADICAAAGWSSPCSFARFYNLDISALQAQILFA